MTDVLPDDLAIIDVDSHLCEAPDLWQSRMPSAVAERVPRVVSTDDGDMAWMIGHARVSHPAQFASAGWHEAPPAHPPTVEDSDPGAFDPVERLKHLDRYGIYAQIQYPNLVGFFSNAMLQQLGPDLATACVKVYNDYQTEWTGADPRRLIAIATMPWWAPDECVVEIERCAALGHRGILFSVDWWRVDLPPIADGHWAPVLAAAQACEMSVNLHVGFGVESQSRIERALQHQMQQRSSRPEEAQAAMQSFLREAASSTFSTTGHVAELVTSGVCARYPSLNWVIVESGMGWWPFLAESLDWTWLNFGASRVFPGRELPSFYMKRQIYGTFWFEHLGLAPTFEMFPENVMFETDYPHSTSLSPGPASPALPPREHAARALAGVPVELARKVLHDNAARLYRID